jgi:hypothetical protein
VVEQERKKRDDELGILLCWFDLAVTILLIFQQPRTRMATP